MGLLWSVSLVHKFQGLNACCNESTKRFHLDNCGSVSSGDASSEGLFALQSFDLFHQTAGLQETVCRAADVKFPQWTCSTIYDCQRTRHHSIVM